jgi:hypothetical protein
MSTRERAATRAPTITPTSWPELGPGCGGTAKSTVVEVGKPDRVEVVLESGSVGRGVGAMVVVAVGVEAGAAVGEGDTVDMSVSGKRI